MRDIYQYFDLIAGLIERSGAKSAELDFDPADRASGTLDGVIYFYDGSRLEFTEVVIIERRRPAKRLYRYQYVRDEEAILRYDNAPHHQGLSNFPHHKHTGRKILPALEPTLKQVLDEVIDLLSEAEGGVLPTPMRRRRSNAKKRQT